MHLMSWQEAQGQSAHVNVRQNYVILALPSYQLCDLVTLGKLPELAKPHCKMRVWIAPKLLLCDPVR